jgi:hypothetical protein
VYIDEFFLRTIQNNKERLSNAQQFLLDGTLDPSDYIEIKNRYEPIIS